MDHPCHQCGAAVEDGRPFCPHCRAPQVRVIVAAPPAPVDVLVDPTSTEDPLDRLTYHAPAATGLFRVALQAGLLGVIANIIPLGLGMVLTGILAALLYHRAAGQTLSSAKAARLGAMSGAIAFAVSSILTVLAIVLFHAQDQFRDMLMKAIDQRAAAYGPEIQPTLQWLHTPEGFATMLAFSMIFALVLSVLFSAIGCVIGAVLFRERNRPTF
jgi:hypothetical protein